MSRNEGSGKPLAGEVALVTGGSRGIGLAIAGRLLEAGSAVALVARDEGLLDQVAASLSTDDGRVLPVMGDVTDQLSMESAVEQTVNRLGSLSIVVNNAGLGLDGPLAEQAPEEWRRVIDVNLLGLYYTTRAALPADPHEWARPDHRHLLGEWEAGSPEYDGLLCL